MANCRAARMYGCPIAACTSRVALSASTPACTIASTIAFGSHWRSTFSATQRRHSWSMTTAPGRLAVSGFAEAAALVSSAPTVNRLTVRPLLQLDLLNVLLELAADELVEVDHAVFHRALVGTMLLPAVGDERPAALGHAHADLLVLERGLVVGPLLGLDELGLEERDLLGVVELDHVAARLRARRIERRDDEHVRIPLDHEVRVVREPDRAVRRRLAVAEAQHGVMPFLVRVGAGLSKRLVHADGLHAVPVAEFPAQVVARDEVAQARVEGRDVVILEVHLDEGLPVERVLDHLDLVEHIALEVELLRDAQFREVLRDVARAIEEHAVPLLQLLAWKVEAREAGKFGRADVLSLAGVAPAVQRARDRAAGERS